MSDQPVSLTPTDYAALLGDIKQRVRHAQTRAMLAVNAELIRLYWDIGALIHTRQQQEGWCAAVIHAWRAICITSCRKKKAFPNAISNACWLFIANMPIWNLCHSLWHK